MFAKESEVSGTIIVVCIGLTRTAVAGIYLQNKPQKKTKQRL